MATHDMNESRERTLDYQTRFVEAVEEGRTSARRGDLLEHDQVVERIEQMLRGPAGKADPSSA